jgi:catechol 2,3-dioxygenase-like lactoylglutathione lyase family enzyme
VLDVGVDEFGVLDTKARASRWGRRSANRCSISLASAHLGVCGEMRGWEAPHLEPGGDAPGFLLALMPTATHQPLPEGFHIGFRIDDSDGVAALRDRFLADGAKVTDLYDGRPAEAYVTFRCWDPDGTEVEVFWEM